jgi:predicted nucleotidyltransferase
MNKKHHKDKHIAEFAKKYLETIKKIYAPEGLWFFGSRISGKAKKGSDIDLILVSKKFKGQKFIYRMGDFLKNIDYQKHIDAICYTPEEFEKKKKEIGIIQDALKNGEKVI